MSTPAEDITNPILERLVEYAHNEVKGFAIKYKDESLFMKVLGFFSKPFNPKFMSDFTTTVGTTMYVPKNDFLYVQNDYVEVVAHELIHMRESKRQGLLYFLRYFFPQALSLLSLIAIGAIWSPWFLLALLCLLFLAPMPAPGRREIELEGYTMTLCVRYWQSTQLLEADFVGIAREFTGPAYYFMWPWGEDVMRDLKMRSIKIRTGQILSDPFYRGIYSIITKR